MCRQIWLELGEAADVDWRRSNWVRVISIEAWAKTRHTNTAADASWSEMCREACSVAAMSMRERSKLAQRVVRWAIGAVSWTSIRS